jgi:hypothetical protein
MIWLGILAGVVLIFGIVVVRGAPYVPSHRRDIRQALTDLYPISQDDVLIDLGSGDGVVLRIASGLGARAIGYEINPILIVLSRFLSRSDPRVGVVLKDFWLTELPDDTTVVYAFTVTRDLKKMIAKLQHEAARLGRPIDFIIYGNSLPGYEPLKSRGAYFLYRFHPLQSL